MVALVVMAVRALLGLVCKLAYSLLIIMYQLFFSISNTSIIDGVVDKFASNVYAILGVLMLFKLAFSIIQYIIDPDQFTNKENGFGAIVKNMFIVVALILAVPIIFDQALRLQRIILKEDIIGRIVTGNANSGTYSAKGKVGDEMAFNLLSGFIRPRDPAASSTGTVVNPCDGYTSYPEDPNDAGWKACVTYANSIDQSSASAWIQALQSGKYENLLNTDIITTRTGTTLGFGGNFAFEFNGLTAAAVGGFAAYILLLFCIDIAVRVVKFSFLELIAPIPIVSYLDPKSKKKSFDPWVQECIKTYVDIFIRLAAIYFAVYLIQALMNGAFETVTYDSAGNEIVGKPGFFVFVFIILGLLMFAKQLPSLIENIFGVKLSGKFTLNALKKIEDEALFGKQVSGGLALGGRTIGNVGRAGLHLGAAGVAGLRTGIGGAIVNKNARGLGFKAGFKYGANKHLGLAGANMSRIGADIGGTLGSSLSKSRDDKTMANNDKVIKAFDTMKSMALDDIKGGKAGDLSREYARRQAELSSLRNLSWEKMTDAERNRFKSEHNGDDLQTVLADKEMDFGKWYNKIAVKEFVNRGIKNDPNNEALYGYEISDDFKTALSGYGTAASLAGEEILGDYDSIKEQRDGLNDDNNKIKNKRMTQQEAKK